MLVIIIIYYSKYYVIVKKAKTDTMININRYIYKRNLGIPYRV